VPDNIEDDLDLSSLNDEDLTLQVHDDLYNGFAKRSWKPRTSSCLAGGPREGA
jgi:hypothetical protein